MKKRTNEMNKRTNDLSNWLAARLFPAILVAGSGPLRRVPECRSLIGQRAGALTSVSDWRTNAIRRYHWSNIPSVCLRLAELLIWRDVLR